MRGFGFEFLSLIAHFTVANVGVDVAAYARPPESLGDAAQSALEAMMCRQVERADDVFAQVRRHDDARRVAVAVYVSEKSVLDDE